MDSLCNGRTVACFLVVGSVKLEKDAHAGAWVKVCQRGELYRNRAPQAIMRVYRRALSTGMATATAALPDGLERERVLLRFGPIGRGVANDKLVRTGKGVDSVMRIVRTGHAQPAQVELIGAASGVGAAVFARHKDVVHVDSAQRERVCRGLREGTRHSIHIQRVHAAAVGIGLQIERAGRDSGDRIGAIAAAARLDLRRAHRGELSWIGQGDACRKESRNTPKHREGNRNVGHGAFAQCKALWRAGTYGHLIRIGEEHLIVGQKRRGSA